VSDPVRGGGADGVKEMGVALSFAMISSYDHADSAYRHAHI
jgi:hypothetical protein